MLTVAIPKRNKLQNIIVLTPKDGHRSEMRQLRVPFLFLFRLKIWKKMLTEHKVPSLTVRKRKNRCIPHVYWGIAIFSVVTDFSILFFPFTFFLDISHLTFCYELIICSETADIMKSIRNSFSFV